MRRHYLLLCSWLAMFLCTAFLKVAAAGPLINSIQFDASGDNVDRITFQLNSPTLPKTFALKAPPRVVFDFPDTTLAKGIKTNMPTSGKFIKGIRTAVYQGDKAKTRVVLDLISENAVDFKQDFNAETHTLVISIFALGSKPAPTPVATAEPAPPAEPPAAKKPAPAEPEQAGPAATAIPPAAPTVTAAAPEIKPEAKPEVKPEAKAEEKPAKQAATALPKPEAAPAVPGAEATVIQPLSEVGPQQQAGKAGGPAPILYSIDFDKNANRGETINFKLNTFNPPVVFGIEEDTPRIVCFFKDTAAGPKLQDTITAKGRFVKSIQVGKYSNPNNIRVVLDLVPNQNYDLQQVFFKEENMFMIIINTNGEKS